MADKIFFISETGLEAMTESTYETELHLQELLATYVDLIPGEQIDAEHPRKWLLVSQEMPISDSADGADRWSIDHLFLDQDGVPTIIETKRSCDTRLRREVIGQLLEYAANAVVYWPVAKLQAEFARTCKERSATPEEALRCFLGDTSNAHPEAFWERVGNNLAAERLRLLLIADEIPPETRRIVEFLNSQMNKTEILAIEIRQFRGSRGKALVPRVIGQTEKAIQSKRGSNLPAKPWDEQLVLAETERECGAADAAIAKQIIEWAKSKADRTYYSGGAQWGRFNVEIGEGDDAVSPFNINSTGGVQYEFGGLCESVFTTADARAELLRRVNSIPGNEFPPEKLTKYPLGELPDAAGLPKFKEVFEWVFTEIRRQNNRKKQ